MIIIFMKVGDMVTSKVILPQLTGINNTTGLHTLETTPGESLGIVININKEALNAEIWWFKYDIYATGVPDSNMPISNLRVISS